MDSRMFAGERGETYTVGTTNLCLWAKIDDTSGNKAISN